MGNNLWRTDPADFARLDAEYGPFTIDAAASDADALVTARYCTEVTDGRLPEHYRPGDRVYCNPPYVGLFPWLAVADLTSRELADVGWLLVLPVGTDTRWFHRFVWNKKRRRFRDGVDVEFPEGRMHFIDPEGKGRDDPRAPSMLVNFLPRELR
jgi:hypothetical protein